VFWTTFLPHFFVSFLGGVIIRIVYKRSIEKDWGSLMTTAWMGHSLLDAALFSNLWQILGSNSSLLFLSMYFHFCTFVQMCLLSRATLHSFFYCLFVSYPASFYFTAILFATLFLPFLPLLDHDPFVVIASLPFVFSFMGLIQTLKTKPIQKWEKVHLPLPSQGKTFSTQLVRTKQLSPSQIGDYKKVLKIVQITGDISFSFSHLWEREKV
jgi:hypothetical protein